MPIPTLEPPYAFVGGNASDEYQPGQPVWVHSGGSWRPGVVLHCSDKAVTVRYRPSDGPGTGADTVSGHVLAPRAEVDPMLDQPELTPSRV